MPSPFKTLLESVEGLSPETITEMEQAIQNKITESEDKHSQEILTLTESHKAEIDTLKESHEQEIETLKESVGADLAPLVNAFLESSVQKWAGENAVAIDSKLKVEAAETFLTGLGTLFVENNVAVPEKMDLVTEMETQITELTESLDAEKSKNLQLVNESKVELRKTVLENAGAGLADTQKERLQESSKHIMFESEEQFAGRLESLRTVIESEDKPKKDDDKKDDDKKDDKDPIKENEEEPKEPTQIVENEDLPKGYNDILKYL